MNNEQRPESDAPPVVSFKKNSQKPNVENAKINKPVVVEKVASIKKAKTAPKVLKKKKPSVADSIQTSSLCLPKDWTNIYKEGQSSQSLLNDNPDLSTTLMSRQWTEQLIKCLGCNKDEQAILQDYEANSSAAVCMFILKTCLNVGLTKKNAVSNFSTSAINNFFQGKLPWSPVNEKITKEHPDLYKLLVKSFQYCVKMAVDDITISPIETDSEFFETLKEYNEEWYVGKQNEPGFAKGILENTKYLFSIYNDEKTVWFF